MSKYNVPRGSSGRWLVKSWVEQHAGSGGPLMALPSMLKGLPDMERGITRIFHRTANPAEFVQVLQALVNIAPQLGVQVSIQRALLSSS